MTESLSSTTETGQVDFEKIDFRLPSLSEPNAPSKRIKSVFNNIPIEVYYHNYSSEERVPTYYMTIGIDHASGAGARIHIEIERQAQGYLGTSLVNNYDSPPELQSPVVLKGAGRTLFVLSMKVMQQYANSLEDFVKDHIIRRPTDGLTIEKWNELFYPLLEKHGYIKLEEDGSVWEKTYYPQK